MKDMADVGKKCTMYIHSILNRKLLDNYEEDAIHQDKGLQIQNVFNELYHVMSSLVNSSIPARVDLTKPRMKTFAPDFETVFPDIVQGEMFKMHKTVMSLPVIEESLMGLMNQKEV